MNQFEIRANALRLRYKAERVQIQKACELYVGHLNTAIGQTSVPEAKDVLRAERARAWEALYRSQALSRQHYRQQLDMLDDEYRLHLRHHPSNRALRRLA